MFVFHFYCYYFYFYFLLIILSLSFYHSVPFLCCLDSEIDKVFSFLSKDEVEKLKQEEEKKIATLQRDKTNKKNLKAAATNSFDNDSTDSINRDNNGDNNDENDDDNDDDNDNEDDNDDESDDYDDNDQLNDSKISR